jgi:hypothetical protein
LPQASKMHLLLLLLLLPSSSSSWSSCTFFTLQQFTWFSKEYWCHWRSTSYSLFCQKLSDSVVCIKYYYYYYYHHCHCFYNIITINAITAITFC